MRHLTLDEFYPIKPEGNHRIKHYTMKDIIDGGHYLTRDEIRRLLEQCVYREDYVMLRLLLETGMRVGEMVSLDIGDIDIFNRTITIRRTKGNKGTRKIPIDEHYLLLNLLFQEIEGRGGSGPLFKSNKCGCISKRQVQRIYGDCAKRAGIERKRCHIHILRHTYAYWASKSGMHIGTINKMLGHRKLQGTTYYLRSLKHTDTQRNTCPNYGL